MDGASEPLAVESFSYSWLVNFPTSLETEEESSPFIEMDPNLTPSKRFLRHRDQDIWCPKFDFRLSASTIDDVVHADELFSNGFVMPVFLGKKDNQSSSSTTEHSVNTSSNQKCPSLSGSSRKNRRRSSPKRTILKYLEFLKPLYRKLSRRSGSERGSGNMIRNRIHSEDATSIFSVGDDWRRSCDSESSIYEAVLHCKKSIGMGS